MTSIENHNAGYGNLPFILCGPILRRVTTEQLVIWFVSSEKKTMDLVLWREKIISEGKWYKQEYSLNSKVFSQIQVGSACFINLIDLSIALKDGETVFYDLQINGQVSVIKSLGLSYKETEFSQQTHLKNLPSIKINQKVGKILHGSCRKIHHDGQDALVAVDNWAQSLENASQKRPSCVVLTGDQVYIDDVAGPVMSAIHQLITRLGLYSERLECSNCSETTELFQHPYSYYERSKLLPTYEYRTFTSLYLKTQTEPVLSSRSRDMHLFTLSEMISLYILTWAPQVWDLISWRSYPKHLKETWHSRYDKEVSIVSNFVEGLSASRRLQANIPHYMIFDDHDVTDDWNLNALWEQRVYSQPLSYRIIGNALFSYFLFQGWGNAPQNFSENFLNAVNSYSVLPNENHHQELFQSLFEFSNWGFEVHYEPKLLVLDTRTQRWRSEFSLSRPSGLMDWESLMDLHQSVIGQKNVILVSAAPIFGVKFIEALQRMMTWFGLSLHVDAENWMAHPGGAMVLLNMFTHKNTPKNFIVLSGDVHYSFVYDIVLRFKENSPRIWQITSSGIKNQFPEPMISCLDRLNGFFYGVYSPLNFFTKRRRMLVRQRDPSGEKPGKRLVNRCAMGLVEINKLGMPTNIELILSSGERVSFTKKRSRVLGFMRTIRGRDLKTNISKLSKNN